MQTVSHVYSLTQAPKTGCAATNGRDMQVNGLHDMVTTGRLDAFLNDAPFEALVLALSMLMSLSRWQQAWKMSMADTFFQPIDSLGKHNAIIKCRTGEIWFLGDEVADVQPKRGGSSTAK